MSNNHRFSESERAAIYRVIAERRDMRHFRPDPVDPAMLKRRLKRTQYGVFAQARHLTQLRDA